MIFYKIIIFVLTTNVSFSCQMQLKYVAVIFRHGDRTPIKPYPTDPWGNESFWPVPFGELTSIGKQQHYKLGKWLREHYYSLISNQYNPSEIYVKSTDVDRTLMSAQVNLAGMYPPMGKSIWDNNLLWQPIPVHTIPSSEDSVLAMKKDCPAYDEEMFKVVNSMTYAARINKYKDLMKYLSQHTGRAIHNFKDINYIYSTLNIEKLYNFTLPKWTKSVFPNKMKEPACYSFVIPTFTPTLSRLKIGPLLKEILNNMKIVTHGHKPQLKISMYSGHDDTIADVLHGLKMFDGNCPVYTSTILMELLYENTVNKYFIRILYRNFTTIGTPYTLSIPYCAEPCPLDRFINLYKNLIPTDWEMECKSKYLDDAYFQLFLIFLIFVVVSGFVQLKKINMYYYPIKV